MSNSKKMRCGVCGEDCTNQYQSPYQMMFLCKDHIHNYSPYAIAEVAQLREGIITELPEHKKKCQVCGDRIEPKMEYLLSWDQQLITCDKHFEARKFMLPDWAKEYFEFKKDFPDTVLVGGHMDKETHNKWSDWKRKKEISHE